MLLGSALGQMSIQEAVGAVWVSGALTLSLALSGWIRTALFGLLATALLERVDFRTLREARS